ncbi:MAG: hypothetical protein HC941_20955 [Microcoleus sp. SU_5_3]|nr:hypothetical protein [Microcoleus sp. SU_5_3]
MLLKINPQLNALKKQTASTTTMQVKKNPQLDALNKKTASTTMQVKTKPQPDAITKKTASTTTMQVKKDPQLDALNKQLASRTTVQVKPNPKFDALNKRVAYSAKKNPPDKKTKSGVGTLLKITSGVGTLLEITWVKTLLEITVVCIILGNLAAIALPSFLYCGNKAKQSEGKQYLSSMNKGQQAKYVDSGAFSNSITALGLGLKTQTTNYKYSISATENAAFSYAVSRSETKNLTSYVGAVFLVPVSPAANNDKTTVSILCAANSRGNTQPPNPILQNDVPVCAAGSSEVSK